MLNTITILGSGLGTSVEHFIQVELAYIGFVLQEKNCKSKEQYVTDFENYCNGVYTAGTSGAERNDTIKENQPVWKLAAVLRGFVEPQHSLQNLVQINHRNMLFASRLGLLS